MPQPSCEAADHNALDWRLLPSLSYVESTGGKSARHNNLFGWDSGRAHFPSPIAGIHTVGYYLSHSDLYKDKALDKLLATYNPERRVWTEGEVRHAADCPLRVIRSGSVVLGIQELDAEVKAPKKNNGNYQDCRPSNISLAGGDLLIFPNAVCEAVKHGTS